MLRRSRLGSIIFIFILTYIVFFPTYYFGSTSNSGQHVLYITLPLIFLIATTVNFLSDCRVFYNRSLFLFFLFISLIYFATIISKFGYLDYSYIFAHLRYLAYFILFMSAYYFSRYYHVGFPELRFVVYFVVFLVLFFIFLQFLVPSNSLIGYISNRELFHSWLGIQIGGPFVWSYSLMFFLVLPFSMVVASFIFFESQRILFLLFIILFSFLFIASQSKSAYIAFFLIIIFYFFIYSSYASLSKKIISLLLIAVFFGFIIFYISNNLESFGNIYRFISAIQEGALDASTKTRLSQMSGIQESLLINPFLGSPFNYLVIENAYGYYLYFFGLIGFLLYIFVIAFFAFINYRYLLLFLAKDRLNLDLVSGFFLLSCSVFIFSLSNPPLDSAKTSGFFWVIMGMYFGVIKNHLAARKLVMTKDV